MKRLSLSCALALLVPLSGLAQELRFAVSFSLKFLAEKAKIRC